MNIEVGKFYRTRDERKAYIFAIEHPFYPSAEHCVFGCIQGCGWHTWRIDGRKSGFATTSFDLIAPWVDPPTPLEVLKELRESFVFPTDHYASVPVLHKTLVRAEAAIAAHDTK